MNYFDSISRNIQNFFSAVSRSTTSQTANSGHKEATKESSIESQTSKIGLETLCDELLIKILSFFREKDLLSIGLTNRRFALLCNDEFLWKELCSSLILKEKKDNKISWKSFYFLQLGKEPCFDFKLNFAVNQIISLGNKLLLKGRYLELSVLDLMSRKTSPYKDLSFSEIKENRNFFFMSFSFPRIKKIDFINKDLDFRKDVEFDQPFFTWAVNNDYLVTGSVEGAIQTWSVSSLIQDERKVLYTFYFDEGPSIIAVEGNFVAVMTLEKLCIWDLRTEECIGIFRGKYFEHLALNNDKAVLGLKNGGTYIIDLTDLTLSPKYVSLSYWEDGDATFRVTQYSKPRGSGAASIIPYTTLVKGNILVTNEMETMLRFWNLKTQECLYSFRVGKGFIEGPAEIDFSDQKEYDVYLTPKINAFSISDEQLIVSISSERDDPRTATSQKLEIYRLPKKIVRCLNSDLPPK